MAFGRLQRAASPKPMGDINMTPLIDVMLVLLIIFMISAPLMTSSLKLNLPRLGAPGVSGGARSLDISMTSEGQLYVGSQRVTAQALDEQLRAAAREAPDTEIALHADRNVPYGRVAELIGRAQQAGLNRVAFVTEAAASASSP